MELERSSEEMNRSSSQVDDNKMSEQKKKKRSRKRKNIMLGCFRRRRRNDNGDSTIEKSDVDGNLDMESASNFGSNRVRNPAHLLVTVNGIIGSAQNWRFAAKQFLKKYPHDVVVHCSESNHSMLTFDGVDVMGSRLADEVLSVVKRHPGLQKISFISHSLGGLVSRYAIAKLYTEEFTVERCEVKGESPYREENIKERIAGLEPINFITSATPHLGCRGHRQMPMFCGILAIEKAATNISWLLGRTGKHLFLTDKDDGKPPLLLRMVDDCEELKFISALRSFKRRVAYANARFDHIVGWSTSSLRRRTELPKNQKLPRNNRYPHVINEEPARTDHFYKAENDDDMTDDMEETMIRGLTKLSWERVDVSFKGSRQRLMAHNTIQVKTPFINSDGADVIQHMLDNFLL
ncbi:DUF676 domain-containing protein [Heracleum sosnowskyi]|uniref:DUF676 domain-containing protein n=1 Tax=Heracleum sosnowskyi TaxID=360622 RepID=A0AAD8IIZ2_9APIA|nr:DUF676 domain-containing protein [Heracleum sosnowskyi]